MNKKTADNFTLILDKMKDFRAKQAEIEAEKAKLRELLAGADKRRAAAVEALDVDAIRKLEKELNEVPAKVADLETRAAAMTDPSGDLLDAWREWLKEYDKEQAERVESLDKIMEQYKGVFMTEIEVLDKAADLCLEVAELTGVSPVKCGRPTISNKDYVQMNISRILNYGGSDPETAARYLNTMLKANFFE